MNVITDDWRGEHLIRAPKRPHIEVAPMSLAKPSKQTITVQQQRQRDADLVRPLAATKTRAEIRNITGLSMNRVSDICQWFEISPVEHMYSCMKRRRGK